MPAKNPAAAARKDSINTRTLAQRFGLTPCEAKAFATHPEYTAIRVAIEAYREHDGQCLPPACPLVRGMLCDALDDSDVLAKLLKLSDGRLPSLSLDQVTEWHWCASPEHRGKVPYMTRQERREWCRLSDATRLTPSEKSLLRALTRKLQYRAERDIDKYC